MQSVVSVRGQTVIPKEIREKLGIKAHTKLHWSLKNGSIVVYPIPEDPVRAMVGVLKNSGYTFQDFLDERNAEREQERRKDEEELKKWRGTS